MEGWPQIDRIGRVLLLGLVGAGVWLRLSSLDALPDPNADEAFYGVQAGWLLRGKPFAWRTPNGNPLHPFNAGLQVLLQVVFGPRDWTLRAPAALGGTAAVVAAYALMRRSHGETAGRIAAVGMAVLPIAIGTSRIGFDSSLTPVFSILAFGCAASGLWVGMGASFLGAFLAHPTNLFLLPGLGVVGLDVAVRQGRRGRWTFAAVMLLLIGSSGLAAASLVGRSAAQAAQTSASGGTLASLPASVVRMLLAAPPGEQPAQTWLAIGLGAIPGIAGLWTLRRQGWIAGRARMALVAGVGLNLAALTVVAGPGALCSGNPVDVGHYRYGLSLAGPIVLAASVLLASLVESISNDARRRLGVAGLMVLGLGLLMAYWQNRLEPFPADPPESMLTPWSDGPSLDERIAQVIRRDHAGRDGPVRVLVESWWLRWPLVYESFREPRAWEVVELYEHAPDPAHTRAAVDAWLDSGGSTVGYAGGPIEQALQGRIAAGEVEVRDVSANGAVRDPEGKHFGKIEVRMARLRSER
jgi:4-amino-4-deoxy-L-arabinose transferase-like glycosyltransferase